MDYPEIVHELRARMEARGWTPYRLWQEIGPDRLTKQTVLNLFSGTDAKFSTLAMVAETLGVAFTIQKRKEK